MRVNVDCAKVKNKNKLRIKTLFQVKFANLIKLLRP
jgi:hypothetical protein